MERHVRGLQAGTGPRPGHVLVHGPRLLGGPRAADAGDEPAARARHAVRAPARGRASSGRRASACSSPTASAPACSCTSWVRSSSTPRPLDPLVRDGTDDRGDLVKTRRRQPAPGAGPPAREAGRAARLRRATSDTGFERLVIGAPTPDVLTELEQALHPYLRERVVERVCRCRSALGRRAARPAGARTPRRAIERRDEAALVARLRDAAGTDGRRSPVSAARCRRSASAASSGCSCRGATRPRAGAARLRVPGRRSAGAARRAATTWCTSTTSSRTPCRRRWPSTAGSRCWSTTPTSTCSGASAPCLRY